MTAPHISAQDLVKHFPVERGLLTTLLARRHDVIHAVDDISFQVHQRDVFGLVGESGSGKSTTGRMLVGLMPPTSGHVYYDGRDIYSLPTGQLRLLRRRLQMVFQDPTASLNPRMTVGRAVEHGLQIHGVDDAHERHERVAAMLEKVGLAPADRFINRYPHQLSGGQRQRVVLARALVLEPDFVVADEPVAMVDVSVRAQIMDLMRRLQAELNLAYVLITHDLAVARYLCNRIAIMYLGKIVELGTREEIFEEPLHPYTQALLSAVPVPDPKARRSKVLPRGEIPSPIAPPVGCRFHPRCPYATSICVEGIPEMTHVGGQHYVACVLYR